MKKELVKQMCETNRMDIRQTLHKYEEDWDVVDELEQDVYVKALESPFDGKSKPNTWIRHVAESVGVDHVRVLTAQKRAEEIAESSLGSMRDEDECDVPYYDRADLSPEILEECWNLDPAREVQAEDTYAEALHQMPPTMAAVVQLRKDGHTNPEIAETLGKSEGYVRKLVTLARNFFEEGNNSDCFTSNSVCERDAKPLLGERFATQADVERACRHRFEKRCSAFEKRRIRQALPDASLAEWREVYSLEGDDDWRS